VLTNDAFGSRCVFEANGPVLRKRPDLDRQTFPDLGLTLAMRQLVELRAKQKDIRTGRHHRMREDPADLKSPGSPQRFSGTGERAACARHV
jgi:hypothetical protein